MYAIVRHLLAACAETRRLGPVVAAGRGDLAARVARAVARSRRAPWAARSPARSSRLLPLALICAAGPRSSIRRGAPRRRRSRSRLAVGHEPLVGEDAQLAGCAAYLAATAGRWRTRPARASLAARLSAVGDAVREAVPGHPTSLASAFALGLHLRSRSPSGACWASGGVSLGAALGAVHGPGEAAREASPGGITHALREGRAGAPR